jgi:hypothetical protein
VCCVLGAGCCVLCVVCCVLCAVCRVLCAVCCVLCAVCCVLCAVCCVLCAVCRVLCAVCCVLCTVCCVLWKYEHCTGNVVAGWKCKAASNKSSAIGLLRKGAEGPVQSFPSQASNFTFAERAGSSVNASQVHNAISVHNH